MAGGRWTGLAVVAILAVSAAGCRTPGAAPATAVDPTAVDPTAVDPTAVDPTAVDPTAVGPTAVDPTDGLAPAGKAPVSKPDYAYTPFADQIDHLRALLDEGLFDLAARLHAEQRGWFRRHREEARDPLRRLADHFNARQAPALRKAADALARTAWPAPESDWETVRAALDGADAAVAAYPTPAILAEPDVRLPLADRLEADARRLRTRIETGAAAAFTGFDHFGPRSFFDAYPVALDAAAFVDARFESLRPALEAADRAALTRFARNYPVAVLGPERWRWLGDLYVKRALDPTGGVPGLEASLAIMRDAGRAGLALPALPGPRVGFVEVTSRTLLAEGQIDFSIEVEVDLPVEADKVAPADAFDNPVAAATDLLVVFDVALAKAYRWVKDLRKVPSFYLDRFEPEANPEWDLAQLDVLGAHGQRSTARLQTTMGAGSFSPGGAILGGLIGILGTAQAEEDVAEARRRFLDTPRFIEKPVYAAYSWDRARIDARKVLTVNYWVIDRRRGTYTSSAFDVTETRRFAVAYGVHPNDNDPDGVFAATNREKDVDDWERRPVVVKLSRIVDDYLAARRGGGARPLPGPEALRAEMTAEKNKALTAYETNRFDTRPLDDPRFDSVVAVYQGQGGMGTGFFVKPDVVITNWHVVDEGRFFEMRLYDGTETFGKVFAKDVRLDLALIKVQRRGRPVRFYGAQTLPLGTPVEIVGHPHRELFTITRGIVSALRREHPVTLPNKSGEKVLYIQSDAATNPGNSGGPVFVGDRVVGVHESGFRKDIGEGLGFSVHYGEVRRFLAEYLPGYDAWAARRGDAR